MKQEEDGQAEQTEKEDGINYFFDSYAIAEIIEGNPSYSKYANEVATISIFNLAEVYLFCLRNYTSEADYIYNQYKEAVVEIGDEVLKEAVKLKKEQNKRELSYADCIGYTYALRNGMKFLTGDKEFKDMKNVEFVK